MGAVAFGLAWVPLFDLLGFEFAAAMGAVLVYVAGWRACGAAASARGGRGRSFPGTALLRALAGNLTLAITPLAVMALNSRRLPTCNWNEGLAFYALLPLCGLLYGTALGFLLGLAWPARRARLALVLWSLGTYVYAGWNMLTQPPKFAYNAFIGYFPGPIYDGVVPLSGTLVLARGIVVLQAVLFTLLALLAWDGERARPARVLREWRGERAGIAAVALLVAVALAAIASQGARLGLRIDRSTIQAALGGHLETPHFQIYYDRGTLSAPRAQELADEHEFRYAQLVAFFGFEPHEKIGSYVYASPAQKKRLMGAAGTSFEDAWNDEFHINQAEYPHPVLMHEMAHLFAARFNRWLPVCPKIGLHEGIAVAAEWSDESGRLELTPHQACAAMETLRLLPDLRRGLGAFGFWTQPGARAYTAAGSFVRFLVDTYGIQRFGVLWSRLRFESAYGKSLATLLDEWRTMLRDQHPTPEQLRRAERLFRAPAIFALPCAHEQARLESEASAALAAGRAAEAESLYTRLRDLAPDDPSHELDLAAARIRAGNLRGGLQLALARLDDRKSGVDRSQALRLAGDAYWKLGACADAESAYADGLRQSTATSEARAFEIGKQVVRDPILGPVLRDYLTDSSLPESAALALLSEARLAQPRAILPRYLLGRRLYYAERFEAAAAELRAALADSGLASRGRRAALDLLGRSELRSRHPHEAGRAFGLLLGLSPDPAERLRLLDWRARCDWFLARSNAAASNPGNTREAGAR